MKKSLITQILFSTMLCGGALTGGCMALAGSGLGESVAQKLYEHSVKIGAITDKARELAKDIIEIKTRLKILSNLTTAQQKQLNNCSNQFGRAQVLLVVDKERAREIVMAKEISKLNREISLYQTSYDIEKEEIALALSSLEREKGSMPIETYEKRKSALEQRRIRLANQNEYSQARFKRKESKINETFKKIYSIALNALTNEMDSTKINVLAAIDKASVVRLGKGDHGWPIRIKESTEQVIKKAKAIYARFKDSI